MRKFKDDDLDTSKDKGKRYSSPLLTMQTELY